MQFRTEISPEPSRFRITHKSTSLFIGSCFSDNIGSFMQELLFPVKVNPFGVVYNPLSVRKNLNILLEGKLYSENDLHFFNDLWFSWDHHSSFSDINKERVLEKINSEIRESAGILKKAGFLIITFGTAWVYRLKESGNVVCNCHKKPSSEFVRELLSPEQITEAFTSLLDNIYEVNPDIKIIFTVSPVRHWKDGAHGNQISKSVLHLTIHKLQQLNKWDCEYFPAYEILLDDLRDYRFYDGDLVHPGTAAVNYISEKFSTNYFDVQTKKTNSEIKTLNNLISHKPKFPETGSFKKFRQMTEKKIFEMIRKYPEIDFTSLIQKFNDT